MNKSFLVLFFKKERLAFLAALVVSACQTAQPGTCKMGHVTDLALTFAHGHLVTPALLNDAPMNLISTIPIASISRTPIAKRIA